MQLLWTSSPLSKLKIAFIIYTYITALLQSVGIEMPNSMTREDKRARAFKAMKLLWQETTLDVFK